MTEILYTLGDVVMLTAAIGATVFAFSYAFFFTWHKTPAGRSLMYLVLALVTWAVEASIARLNPEYFGREWARIVIYTIIAFTTWKLVGTLWLSWRRNPFEVERHEHLHRKEKK